MCWALGFTAKHFRASFVKQIRNGVSDHFVAVGSGDDIFAIAAEELGAS